MRMTFNKAARRTDVLFTFAYKGVPVEVQARVRPDGTLAGSIDYFAQTGNGRQLVYSVDRQIGTLEDAVAEFVAYQESQTPHQVYDNDTDRLGVGENGPIRNSADEQVKRMNDADSMVSSGRMGLRYYPPKDQELDM